MKRAKALVSGILIAQALWSPALASDVSFTPPETGDSQGVVDGRVALKAIGPLHLSEGVADIKHNHVVVLSDAADSPKEAELQGELLGCHTLGDGTGQIIEGVALFTSGYSLPAIDNIQVDDSIRTKDGSVSSGHIVDITSDQVRVKTKNGITAIPTKEITEIKSPRAYEFSLPETATVSAAQGGSSAAQLNEISFNPTYIFDPNNPPPTTLKVKTVQQQLSEPHRGKTALKLAALAAAFGVCVGIPIGVALICPKPPPAGN